MKKFNVPTQMDVILQLITSDKRKPHLRKEGRAYVAFIPRPSGSIKLSYHTGNGLLLASLPPIKYGDYPQKMATLLLGWSNVYDWAKRVDANRYRWDK